jgi:hypothetical protein
MSTSYYSQANSSAATLSPQAGTVEIGYVAQVSARNTADTAGPDNATAVQAVQAAITAANPTVNGVKFGAFSARVFPTAGNFTGIYYEGRGDTHISFCQFQGTSGGWLPLGDIVALNDSPPAAGVMFFAPGSDPAAFANPTGFELILAEASVVYWKPIPPAGYVAVGICFSNGPAPATGNYWCVRESYVQPVSQVVAWSDRNAHWHANGLMFRPAFTTSTPEVAPEGSILILPPTLLAGGLPPYALVGTQATLAVAPIARQAPVYVDGETAPGDTTAYGLGNVVVVPFTAVPGDAIPNQALRSPFYYVASEPSWQCTRVLPTPSGGTLAYTETVGVSQTDSTRVQQTTSMTVSCEFGAAYGGASASVSASLTEELQLETSQSTTGSTENIVGVTLNLPVQPVTSIWEGQNTIQVFRADGSTVTSVTYSMADARFVPSGMKPALKALQAALARG